MGKNFRELIVRHLFAVILLIFGIIVAWLNYTPGTLLSGWDNLHTEFNYTANLARSLSAVWEEYQGLGLVGGMGHGANLFRELTLAIFSPFLPQGFTRYAWHFLMLIVGPVGLYFFLTQVLQNKNTLTSKAGSFAGGMYYLLNLATVQYFYVPFESFSSFYGLFPWLLFSLIRYLEKGGKKNLLLLFIIALFATSGFLVQTLFVVIAIVIITIFANFLLKHRKHSIQRLLASSIVLAAVNAFWFLPVVYFSVTNVDVVNDAKINSIATIETQYQNEDFGDIEDISKLKGFWMEYLDWQGEEFDRLFLPWQDHLNDPFTNNLLTVIFVTAVVGILLGSIFKVSKYRVALIGTLIFAVLMLTSGRGINVIPILGQIFRSAFTKVSPILAFTYAWGIAMFVSLFSKLVPKWRGVLSLAIAIYLIVLVGLSVKPVFQGKLISENMKLNHPEAYFSLYQYMNEQPKESRVAFFPIQSQWGWNFYNWSGGMYRGSGFLWYGIEQPILDRAFDVWSKYNENFYHQASTALYREAPGALLDAFDKYDVSYVLLDESVTSPGAINNNIMKYEYTKKVLPEIGGEVVWQKDFLTLYKLPTYNDRFLSAGDTYVLAEGNLDYTRVDNIYSTYGTYVSSEDAAFYPFSYLTKENLTENVGYTDNSLVINAKVNTINSPTLTIPTYQGEYFAAANVTLLEGQIIIDFEQPYLLKADGVALTSDRVLPKLTAPLKSGYKDSIVWINGIETEISLNATQRVEGIKIAQGEGLTVEIFDKESFETVNLSSSFFDNEFVKCWERKGVAGKIEPTITADTYSLRTQDAVGCNAMRIGEMAKDNQVKIKLQFKSDGGARPHFCFQLEGNSECLHDEVFYHSATSTDWKEETRQLLVPQDGNYWLVVMARPPDKQGEAWKIEYKAPEIEVTEPTGYVEFVPEVFDLLWTNHQFEMPRHVSKLSIELPLIRQKIDFSQFRSNISNCDVLKRGNTDKVIKGNLVYYQAEKYGAICDFASVNAFTSKEYLVRLEGKNEIGRSLKMYLYNSASGRNDLEVLLSEGKFDNTYSVISWPGKKGEYTLTFENRSYGSPSHNMLEDVSFYNIPLTWLTNWRVGDVYSKHNNLEVIDTNKYGTAIYRAKVKGDGLLKLSQGFDPGWKAIVVPHNPLRITHYDFLEHVKVNSWANGWIIPSGHQSPTTDHLIYIIFWPQFLQWFGFVLLIITPIAIWRYRR